MTYYIWKGEIRDWRGRAVELILDWPNGFAPSTIGCEPIADELPPRLTYEFRPARAPLTDRLWSASKYNLYSPAAIKLLGDFNALDEVVPATVYERGGNILTADYSYVHVFHCLKAVDWGRSEIEPGIGINGDRFVRHARHIVLDEKVIPPSLSVFRLEEVCNLVLVNEAFRNEWERRGLTGAEFLDLEDYPEVWRAGQLLTRRQALGIRPIPDDSPA